MNLEKPHRLWEVVKDIATEPLFVILVCTASLYFILGEYGEGTIMLIALGFVSGISLYQENRSRTAVEALKKLSAPLAKVIRNGQPVEIDAAEIVIEDLILLEDGNLIPADAILVERHDFSVNESVLTGESLPVEKNVGSKVFQGTLVMTGSCVARVVTIGRRTEFGKISQSLQEIEPEQTPLQVQIKAFVKKMVAAGLVAFLVVWGVNYFISRDVLHSLLRGLTLAMSVLPEEIPVAFSTFMALGAYHLYKMRVIARTPHTVEALGAATVICVDKTGTITENRMELTVIYDFKQDKLIDFTTEVGAFNEVLEYAMWASEPKPFDEMEKSVHGMYGKLASRDLRSTYSFTHEYPLSGKPPIMTHVFTAPTGERVIACKGSVEGILNQTKLTAGNISRVEKIAHQLAARGFRVLAVAQSLHTGALPASQHEFEFDLLGLIGFHDPPKQNISGILEKFYSAGIQVKIITGDYAETAVSIARQIELKNDAQAITGDQVMNMSNQELQARVGKTSIFARMFPEAKLRVIEALKINGEVVAMTGDGVNDGPALKAAHIGIAMGQRGSEVAKQAASLVLVDDDLEHMTEAVALGRRIYENLKKAIQYIISIHIPIILIVTMPLLLLWKYVDIFSPVHVIFLELIMGPTCSVIFENEPMEANSMHKRPRKMTASFFSLPELSLSIIQGLVITTACLTLGYYMMERGSSEALVRTVIYTTLILSNLFLTLVNRSFYYSVFTTFQYKNPLIPMILSISLLILFLSIYARPVQNLFKFEPLTIDQIGLCLFTAAAGVLWVEGYKWRKRQKSIN
ncbi:MAG: cation-translocating P-type ATPase [Cyclobacteriaceae bacterium]|nr:cation-translocating P-type ATPase [Cyclobacteriaceae bacterium]